MTITLDTGAETSMIKASVARSLDITIDKSSQQALQADGVTPLTVVGETHVNLSRANKSLTLDASRRGPRRGYFGRNPIPDSQ